MLVDNATAPTELMQGSKATGRHPDFPSDLFIPGSLQQGGLLGAYVKTKQNLCLVLIPKLPQMHADPQIQVVLVEAVSKTLAPGILQKECSASTIFGVRSIIFLISKSLRKHVIGPH